MSIDFKIVHKLSILWTIVHTWTIVHRNDNSWTIYGQLSIDLHWYGQSISMDNLWTIVHRLSMNWHFYGQLSMHGQLSIVWTIYGQFWNHGQLSIDYGQLSMYGQLSIWTIVHDGQSIVHAWTIVHGLLWTIAWISIKLSMQGLTLSELSYWCKTSKTNLIVNSLLELCENSVQGFSEASVNFKDKNIWCNCSASVKY